MSLTVVNALGLKCPQPTLKLTGLAFKMKKDDILEVLADCSTFEKDVRDWCHRFNTTLLWIKSEGSAKKCQIKF